MADAARGIGGLLLAAGAVLVLSRETLHHHVSNFEQMLAFAVPAVILYMLALGAGRAGDGRTRASQALLLVTSLPLGALALVALLEAVGASGEATTAVAFAAIALPAAYAAARTGVAYAILLAALALFAAWNIAWVALLHPSPTGIRWLLLLAALLLAGVATALARRDAIGGGEVATVAGLAAVAAGAVGIVVALGGEVLSLLPLGEGQTEVARHLPGAQSFIWDLYLLAVSCLLAWVGARRGIRGPGYVALLGLLLFVDSVSAELARVADGHARTASLLGWPLALLLLGVLGLLAPALLGRTSGPRADP
jgi:hypothetical protein